MSADFVTGIIREEMRLRRGWILRILHYFLAKGSELVNDNVLRAGLHQVGHAITLPTLLADLSYLSEKGYVEVVSSSTSGIDIKLARITAKGRDLHDRFSDADPGIDFGE